mgnify:CR=1 FL=1
MDELCFCNRDNTMDSKGVINLYDDKYKKGYDNRYNYKNDDVDMDKIAANDTAYLMGMFEPNLNFLYIL